MSAVGLLYRTSGFCLKLTKNYSCLLNRLETFATSALQQKLLFNPSNLAHATKIERFLWCLAPCSVRNYKADNLSVGSCLCGGFHSKGDIALLESIKKELEGEKQRMNKFPSPSKGWALQQTGSSCLMTRDYKNECVKVSFNVNLSIPPASTDDPGEQEDVISQPNFTVEISKPTSSLVLTFDCYFPDEYEDAEDDETREHSYNIRAMTVHDGKVDDTTYSVDIYNNTLFENAMDYLQERGITQQYTDELVNLATAVENREYITSLERLSMFVNC